MPDQINSQYDSQSDLAPTKPSRHISVSWVVIGVLIVFGLFFASFAVWSYSKYSKLKGPVEQHRTEAADLARKEEREKLETEFNEREKDPRKVYTAPDVFGAFSFQYPKTWSIYSSEDENGKLQFDLYAQEDVVRTQKNKINTYILRIKLERALYADTVNDYRRKVDKEELTAAAVTVSGISGTRYSGKLDDSHTGDLILLPIRDKTFYLWTESNDYIKDLEAVAGSLKLNP